MRSCAPTIMSLAGACGLAISVAPALGQESAGQPLKAALSRVYPVSAPVLVPPAGGGGTDATGPDVIVGELINDDNSPPTIHLNLSPIGSNATHFGYGIGTESCNLGTQDLLWISNQARHPVIPQNIYKMYTSGGYTRFEQVGQSWCKHAFTALTYGACATCNGHGGSVLGVGCSDPYTASRNASQTNATGGGGSGPRYDINPYTGVYPWPIPTPQPITDATSRRVRVARADLEVTSATSATQFFAEAMYVTWDDARWGNGKNNASYRRMFCTSTSTGAMTLEGATTGNNYNSPAMHRTKPAIYAWQDYGNNNTADTGVMVVEVGTGGTFTPPADPTGDGIHLVASKATDLGGGIWHYEYAVENINSDRAGGSFSVPLPAGVIPTNVAWRGIDIHSGVPADDASRNAAWTSTVTASSVTWAAPVAYDPAFPKLGNGLRWGTMYNFRFDAQAAPVNNGTVTLGLFKPMVGWPSSVTGTAWVPGTATGGCYANCDNSVTPPILNVADFTCFLSRFAANDAYANCDGSTTEPVLNVQDFSCYLAKFAAGCP